MPGERGQRIWQLGINHARSSLCRSGVGYHVGVPQLLVVGQANSVWSALENLHEIKDQF
jgi:hypothetical protein